MKFSLIKNDKSTVKDEIILALMVGISAACGILLIKYRPTIWIIDESDSVVMGVLFLVFAFMFFPGLIYRLTTNDKKEENR